MTTEKNTSEKEYPKISIRCHSVEDLDKPCSLEFRGSNNNTVIASLNQFYRLVCTAKYLVKYEVTILEEKKSGLYLSRTAEDLMNISTYAYKLQYYFSTDQSSTGSVTCRGVDNPDLYHTLHFFTQATKFFTKSGETIHVTNPKDYTVVPCPSNYADAHPTLEHRNSTQEPFCAKKWPYNPKEGFTPETNQTLKGEFKCSSPLSSNDSVLIRFVQAEDVDAKDNFDGQLEYRFPSATPSLECWEINKKNVTKLVDIFCTHPNECDLYRNCAQTGSCSAEKLEGKHCLSSNNCTSVKRAQSVGLAFCQSGRTKLFDYHFVGLDRKNYLLSEARFSERALIYMDDVGYILYVDEPARFYCQALAFLFSKTILFSVIYQNGTKAQLPPGTFMSTNELRDTEAFGTIQNGVHVNLTEDMTEIVCHAPWYNSSTNWYTKSRKFIVLGVKAPSIQKSDSESVFYTSDTGRTLRCKAEARPPPTFRWFRNGWEINTTSNESDFRIARSEMESVLQFPEVTEDLDGTYECVVTNRVGNDSVSLKLNVRGSKISPIAVSLSTIGLVVISVVTIVFFCRLRAKYLDAKVRLRNLTEEEIDEFENGNPEMLVSAYDNLQENAQFLPFDESYRLREQDVEIDKYSLLGSGAYGVVVRGKYLGDPIAVKTTLPSADVSYFKALLAELKVMAYIGSHPNVVHFIGALTSRVRERIVYVIVELSQLGDLESYLKSHRATYLPLLVDEQTEKSEVTYHHVIKRVTPLDSINWCRQIAAGMEHLASKKVIHGDLAARNILLFEGDVAKITDFGLARQLYENPNYTKTNTTPLPWRWMAIESLRDLVFSTKSDVWAFGVTAWEIFTMAETPYPGIGWSIDFLQRLEAGLRPSKPKFATDEIYALLARCWEADPDNRPGFEELKEFFENLLKDSHKRNLPVGGIHISETPEIDS